jgi:peptidyl-prolyl cis-trans isomerase A (cyclophilin A)
MGDFEVNLFDTTTPGTVANFLNYVNNGAYSNSVLHRSVPGFVVQGGGFTFDLATPLDNISTNSPVANEPVFSNVRGTIAMAKLGGDPDSATSQWFFNLGNNAANLDGQNGGFTVFGQVVGDGMDVVDAIAALPRFAFAAPLGELPLQNYTMTDFDNGVQLDAAHLILVHKVIVSDSTVDSAASLNPAANTANSGGAAPPPPLASDGGGGGGSFGFPALFALLLVYRCRKA